MKQILSAAAIATLAFTASCSNRAADQKASLAAQQQTIDSMRDEMTRKHIIDSMNTVAQTQYVFPQETAPVAVTTPAPARQPAVTSKRSTKSRYSGHTRSVSGNSSSNNSVSQPQPVVYQQAPAEQKKKGWSAKAKGAVIGAGTGAAAGAIINKRNRAAGAVIGGVLGAAVGTGTGAVIDKRTAGKPKG